MMRFSQSLKASILCQPSPDGQFIATYVAPHVNFVAVATLSAERIFKLSNGLKVTAFRWSSSSERLLIASLDEIHVVSPQNEYHAIIKNPTTPALKSTFVDFGANHDEICVFCEFGIKLLLFDISSSGSRVVEVGNPKFYQVTSAPRGFSFRPLSRHLAILTRSSGRDAISIHCPNTRKVQRSWLPDIVDAQGLAWTPDGQWLFVWESPAQGPRILVYSSDGHLFKDWTRWNQRSVSEDDPVRDDQLGAGVKLVVFDNASRYVAIADYSSIVSIYGPNMMEYSRFKHPNTLQPKDTLKVWQQQIGGTQPAAVMFVESTQPISPSYCPGITPGDLKSGCHFASFDISSVLLATILEDAPSTVWVWDLTAFELRAVLLFHSDVSAITWHPSKPELLLLKCEGPAIPDSAALSLWDPLEGPRLVDFASHLPGGQTRGRTNPSWLNTSTEGPTILFANREFCVVSFLGDTSEAVPWYKNPILSQRPPTPVLPSELLANSEDNDDPEKDVGVDDTFAFKKMAGI